MIARREASVRDQPAAASSQKTTASSVATERFTYGTGHAWGVTFDERVVCWGNNVYGETIPPT